MPIHDQSYRHFEGAKAPPGRAWLVIAKAGIMTMIRKRLFLGLLVVSWLPFVVRAVQIYFTDQLPAGGDVCADGARRSGSFWSSRTCSSSS